MEQHGQGHCKESGKTQFGFSPHLNPFVSVSSPEKKRRLNPQHSSKPMESPSNCPPSANSEGGGVTRRSGSTGWQGSTLCTGSSSWVATPIWCPPMHTPVHTPGTARTSQQEDLRPGSTSTLPPGEKWPQIQPFGDSSLSSGSSSSTSGSGKEKVVSFVKERVHQLQNHLSKTEENKKEETNRVRDAVQKIEAVKKEEELTSRRQETDRSRKIQMKVIQVSQKSVCKRKYQEVTSEETYLQGLWPEAERKLASTAPSRSLDFAGNHAKTS